MRNEQISLAGRDGISMSVNVGDSDGSSSVTYQVVGSDGRSMSC